MTIDFEGISSRVDLREIVQSELGKGQHMGGSYHVHRCPFHGDRKPSMSVRAEGYKCFACNASGNVFTWMKERHQMSGQQAAHYLVETFHLDKSLLGNERWRRGPARPRPIARPRREPAPEPALPPDADWQAHAAQVLAWSQDSLWADTEGAARARHYLMDVRGLSISTIRRARLGYVPARQTADYQYGIPIKDWRRPDGKHQRIACGIVIPHIADGHIWALRVRRPVGQPKYMGVTGGSKALYGVDWIAPRLPVLIVEGEFDSLIMDQICGPGMPELEICTVALASASNHTLDGRWLSKLVSAPVVLARMDADQAGSQALAALQRYRYQPVALPPGHKDLNDYYLAEGPAAVREWVRSCLEAVR